MIWDTEAKLQCSLTGSRARGWECQGVQTVPYVRIQERRRRRRGRLRGNTNRQHFFFKSRIVHIILFLFFWSIYKLRHPLGFGNIFSPSYAWINLAHFLMVTHTTCKKLTRNGWFRKLDFAHDGFDRISSILTYSFSSWTFWKKGEIYHPFTFW